MPYVSWIKPNSMKEWFWFKQTSYSTTLRAERGATNLLCLRQGKLNTETEGILGIDKIMVNQNPGVIVTAIVGVIELTITETTTGECITNFVLNGRRNILFVRNRIV